MATSYQPEENRDLRAMIIQRCGLSEADIARVTHYQETRHTSFGEAAVRLGYASQADIERHSGLVHLPRAKQSGASPGQDLVIAHEPDHPRSEQIRSLRTELLLHHGSADEAGMLAVLSPCAKEGRSQLAAEIAIAFSQLGRPTLLVDTDMRHSRQHLLFGTDNEHGLSQALAQRERPLFHEVTGLPELSLLTAGPSPSNALELLSDRWFEVLVSEWREYYAFVIFDTPAVNRYADGLVVATIVGHVLSLSRAKHTSFRDTRNLLQRLASTRSSIHGAVINHF